MQTKLAYYFSEFQRKQERKIFTLPGIKILQCRITLNSRNIFGQVRSPSQVKKMAKPSGLMFLLINIFLLFTSSYSWNLVWSDEFNGNHVDQSNWVFINGDGCPNLCGNGNNELQWYQSENTYVRDGKLVIEAKKENVGGKAYTSSKLVTQGKRDWTYGKVEIRARLPESRGIWPAIWMLPSHNRHGPWPRSGEIDIMELVGHEPSKSHFTLHYGEAWNNKGQTGSAYTLPGGQKFSDGYHTFSIEWKHDEIKGFVDGNLLATVTKQNVNADRRFLYPFNDRFYLVLNVAVGGTWPGSPDGSTRFPQKMEVDYVRVYQ